MPQYMQDMFSESSSTEHITCTGTLMPNSIHHAFVHVRKVPGQSTVKTRPRMFEYVVH